MMRLATGSVGQAVSRRPLKWISGRFKEISSAFSVGQSSREDTHKMEHLPTEEKKEYLRKKQVPSQGHAQLVQLNLNSLTFYDYGCAS